MQLKAAVTDSERPCKAQLCAARPAACRDAGDFLLSSLGLSAGGLLSLPTLRFGISVLGNTIKKSRLHIPQGNTESQ